MTRRVYLHVGAPKSGTTYLQRVLRHNQAALARQGVLVAGRTHADLVHAGFVIREDPRLQGLPERAARSWDRIVDEIRAFPGDVAVVSYELLAGARRRQARRAIDNLAGLEVHVIVTTRDLGRAVSSAWQERLKFALTEPLESWRPRPASDSVRAEWGWRTMDPGSVASRWGATLPPEQVHIVTAPRGGGMPTALWDRFAEACSLEDVRLDLNVPMANESLGVAAAEVLRRVNEHDLGPITGAREQARWLRDRLAHAVLADLDAEPMSITDEQLADAQTRAQEAVSTIRTSGWQVHGDLDDVQATRRAGRLPSEVPAEELLDVSTRAIVQLLLELRAQETASRERSSGAGVMRSASGWRSRVVDFGGSRSGAKLDALIDKADALERRVQDSRRLHERVASLADLVEELLLPPGQEDRRSLKKALRRYRGRSL